MSVYTAAIGGGATLAQKEIHLYGSSRLGMLTDLTVATTSTTLLSGFDNANFSTFTRGEKIFELSNHLGNVLVTISVKKLAKDVDNNGTIDYYITDVITANDYYPFGMNMPGRKYSSGSGYRYGFNGKELDNSTGEGNLDFGARIMDVRLGRWLGIDPLYKKYPMISSYTFANNNPILFINVDGREFIVNYIDQNGVAQPAIKLNSWKDVEKLMTIASYSNNLSNLYEILIYLKGETHLEKILTSKKSISIEFSQTQPAHYDDKAKKIIFSPLMGMETISDKEQIDLSNGKIEQKNLNGLGEYISPAGLFLHEIGHAYNHLFQKKEEYYDRLKKKITENIMMQKNKMLLKT